MTAADFGQHPNVHDNSDGTWTVTDGLYGQTWTVRHAGYYPSSSDAHYVADSDGGHRFSGGFDEVCFNILGSFG